jgi:acyl-CoA synthetase (AMP-forming)/AMP-acid ligase II
MSHGLADGGSSGYGTRVALMASPGAGYVAGMWATWLSGRISVPLAESHPPRYFTVQILLVGCCF